MSKGVPSPQQVLEAAGRLGVCAEIEAITLRQLNWTTNEIGVQDGEEPQLQPTITLGHGRKGAMLRYQVKSSFSGVVTNGELFRMEAVHEVFFSIPPDINPDELDLDAFGSVSVFFMVFPYIRELMHRLTVGAGLPPVLLRPFRLPFNPANREPSPETVAALGASGT